jgi:hypothetical protein
MLRYEILSQVLEFFQILEFSAAQTMLRDTLVCRQNLQVCRTTYGDTPHLHYISGLVCRSTNK